MILLPSLLGIAPLMGLSLALETRHYARADSYDYIIVGGGTAGNALAARLSTNLTTATILVIEAGPFEDALESINIPGKRMETLGTVLDWNFTSTETPALNNRTISINRAKVLGGCSAHNGLAWIKASKAEYDSWEKLGNEGWNWETISAAMLRSENFTNGPPGSGTTGPIQVLRDRYRTSVMDLYASSIEAMIGLSPSNYTLQGSNIATSVAGPYAISPVHYNASFSTNAYLPMAGDNLYVSPNTVVAKVNLQAVGESTNGAYQATGVTLDDGTVITASKEVILAAGSIQSPQLLELSGIGQTDVLSAANIPTLIDLEGVDHQAIALAYQLADNVSFITTDRLTYNTTFAEDQLSKWYEDELSIYDIIGSNVFTFTPWPNLVGDDVASNLKQLAQEAVRSGAVKDDVITQMRLSFLNDTSVAQVEAGIINGLTSTLPTTDDGSTTGPTFFTLESGIEHALSRGSVHVNASNPAAGAPPVIDLHWFTNDYDVAAMVALAKAVRRIAATAPLAGVVGSEYTPGLAVVPANATDAQWWADYLQGAVTTAWHPSGTCAMLPLADGGVVDSDLKVYGTSNLRVVDASIAPLLVSGHPTTLVYGIAEVAAEKIAAAAAAVHVTHTD